MPDFEDIKYVNRGGLNYDDSLSVFPSEDYRYALNCIHDESGEYGSVTNIKGNQLVAVPFSYNGVNTTIGSCEDKELRALIWFVYNNRNHHSIIRYKIEQNLVEFLLHDEPVLNFDLDHKINNPGIIGSGYRKMLFWTDDYNPPRKLNIAMAKGYTVCSSTSTTSTYTTTTASSTSSTSSSTSSTSTTSTSAASTSSSTSSTTTPAMVVFCDEYMDVYNSMKFPPGYGDAVIQNNMFSALVDLGVYDKAEIMDIFATNFDGRLINWASPGIFNPDLIGDIGASFIEYEGFTGNSATEDGVRLNFRPAIDGTKISQNNICVIIGVGSDIASAEVDFGATEPGGVSLVFQSRALGDNANFLCNTTNQNLIANVNGKAHYAMSRNNANNFNAYINFDRTNIIRASTGFISRELGACGRFILTNFFASDGQIRYVFVFTYLTSNEIREVMDIMEEYLDAYGTGLVAAPFAHSTSTYTTTSSTSTSTTIGYDYRRRS